MKAQTENYPRTNLISLLLLSILVATTTYAGRYASSNLEIEEIERDMESISKKMDACTAKMQSGASCKEIIIFLEKRNLRELADIQHRASYYWHNSEDTESARTEIHRIINNGFTASYDRFVDTVVRVYQGDGYSWTEDCLGDLTKAIGPEVPDKREANDKSDFCRSMEKWHIFYNSGKRRTYKISEDLANRTNDNLFSWQVPVAIQVGAERWNHEANTGVYQYIGTYDGGGRWQPYTECDLENRHWGKFFYENKNDEWGRTWGDCCHYGGIGCDTFRIAIKNPVVDFDNYLWIATHELGHAYDVGHPKNGEYAVMCSNPECTISYVLREYDLVCSRNYGSFPKNRIGLYRVQDENGTIGSWGYVPFYYYNGWDLLRTSGIATGTNIDFVHLFKESLLFLPRWGQEQIVVDVYGLLRYILTPIGLKFDSYPEKYILFRDVEDPDYLSGTDCTEGMSDPDCYYKRLIALVSNDDFVSWSYDSVFRCIPDNPYSPFSCVDTEFNYVETLRKPEVAYYPGGQAGIFSIGQNKMVFYIDHEQRIRWLFGKPNEDGMAVHFTYDQDTQLDNWIQNNTQLHTDFGKSNVKPAVACSSECTNGATYQCKLAYVPSNQSGQENNKDGKIFFWNFNVSVDYAIVPPYTFVPYRHTINWDANGPQATAYYSTDLKTSGDLAMWETAGYFYLGFKSVSPEVRTVIFRKPVCDDDMIAGWTIFDDNTGWTDDGFTVLENPNGSRALVYTTTETYGPEP